MAARQPCVCPDRDAVPVERQLVHEDTCPNGCPNGAAQDERMAADLAWFDAHPDAQRYTRQISRAKVVELKVAGAIPDGWDAAGYVTVTQLGPGLRARTFAGVWIFPRDGAA